MFLSKVTLLPSANAAKELAALTNNGAYGSHQLLWKLFTADEKREFLFREQQGAFGRPEFYVLSKHKPEQISPMFAIQSKAFAPKLAVGDRLAFKLRVNPTIAVKNGSGKSKRHDVLMHAKYQHKGNKLSAGELKAVMEQAAHQWIANEERLAQWGIQLDSLPDIECYTQHDSKKSKEQRIRFSTVDFQGVLTVKAPELFWQQYRQGFGRAKAMGCGLMLIRRI
ncbi:type I-E CRISPR-associated protein Cas6/Cse3/CasE [Thalassomonas viridans]|uniref:Type I-E CRISPR-associated protein Cas6/Cse3/CasE n=1 Tax=Thalassomonas viridans TaxID=137584 RepID=A0AAF0C973_9GAMM|nr:type I-E CRISPR-associated protein Cas6/Cse3/CasE [Thalassomonas viridans]WDE04935.1 type I-E CRISPR-associated protein Cas6/Cse3/CasE [Thalassomonas viridans]